MDIMSIEKLCDDLRNEIRMDIDFMVMLYVK